MKTVLLPALPSGAKNSLYRLDARKAQHVRKVLRMEWGESLRVTDGKGSVYAARLEQSGDDAAVAIESLIRSDSEPHLTQLFIGLAKNNTMDWLVEKAVECGATKITPVVVTRSVVRPKADELEKYQERWQAIIDGAVEQSETPWRPMIDAPMSWKEFKKAAESTRCAKFSFQSELRDESEKENLTPTWSALQAASKGGIQLFIGPEGGFDEEERADFKAAGFEALTLGNTVLRVETAVISSLSLIKFCRALH